MKVKKFYMLLIVMMVLGSINFTSAQELGRKGARKPRHRVGLAIGTRSYLNSDFFKDYPGKRHPEGLVPADLRGNSYNIMYEGTPSPGLFGVEVLASIAPSSTTTETADHSIQALSARLSGKIHPFATTSLSRYLDLYVGGGATGLTVNYETNGFSDSYKVFGPHAIAGFEYYLGTFSSGKWQWGAFFNYIFTPTLNVERVGPPNRKKDFNAGGHLFIFGIKFNALR